MLNPPVVDVELVVESTICVGSVMVTLMVPVHEFASVTVTS